MREEKVRVYIRVIPQFTIRPNTISLIAEEDKTPFKKGSLVIQVQRETLNKMSKPFMCEIVKTTKRSGFLAKPVLAVSK